jgi:hypothetical protein
MRNINEVIIMLTSLNDRNMHKMISNTMNMAGTISCADPTARFPCTSLGMIWLSF